MKEENVKSEYQRKVDKSLIPTCNIMGVNIAAINMNWLLKYIDENLSDIKGDYICVSNVHTTVTSYEDAAYCAVQNGGLMAIPDGGPLSSVGRKRGYSDMDRTTGPSLMGEIFKISAEKGYRHYFYGSTEETLKLLEEKLQENYPGIQIAGMYISKQVIIRCVWPVKRIPVQLFHKDPETGSVPLKDFDRSAPAVCKKQTYSGSMGRGGISA